MPINTGWCEYCPPAMQAKCGSTICLGSINTMRILALDLGTTTGWATQKTSGTYSFKMKKKDGKGVRYLNFRNWLIELHKALKFEAVFYEEVMAHKGTHAAHCYGGFAAHLFAFCEEHDIPYDGVGVGTIKKHGCGKGNGNKEAMMGAYFERWGHECLDDNECDARWLLDYVLK